MGDSIGGAEPSAYLPADTSWLSLDLGIFAGSFGPIAMETGNSGAVVVLV